MIPIGQDGIGSGMAAIDQHNTEVLLWQLEIIEDILSPGSGWVNTTLLFKTTRLEEPNELNLNIHLDRLLIQLLRSWQTKPQQVVFNLALKVAALIPKIDHR